MRTDDYEERNYGKYLIIPQDPEDRKILLAVDRKTRSDVDYKYGFIMDYDWESNTVANCAFETILNTLTWHMKSEGGDGEIGINFFDLFIARVSLKTNDRAEKEGNINIFFETGSRVDELISKGPPAPYKGERLVAEQVFGNADPKENEFIHQLDHHIAYNLSTTHAIHISDKKKLIASAIAYTFFENLFTELIIQVASGDPLEEGEERLRSVNFNDNIEIHAVLKNDAIQMLMRPGLNAKLLIKNDGITERTMGDLGDD